MTLHVPLVMQAGGGDPTFPFSAMNFREMISAITAQEGVYTGGKVVQRGAGPNLSVDIPAMFAVVAGDDVASQGHYIVYNDGTVNLVTPSPPGAGTRIHRVILQVRDKLHLGSWSTYDAAFLLQEDTGTGTPALPASAIELALITMTSSTTSITDADITDARITAHMHPSLDESVASTGGRPANPVTRQRIYRSDLGYYEYWNGSAWTAITPRLEPEYVQVTDVGTTTSTGGSESLTSAVSISKVFTAPPSGKVMLRFGAFMNNSTLGNLTTFGVRVKVTSGGATFYTTTTGESANTETSTPMKSSSEAKVTGLTPGTSYTAVGWHKVSSGTGTFDYRHITVDYI